MPKLTSKQKKKSVGPEMEISGPVNFDISTIYTFDDFGEMECVSKKYLYSGNGKDHYRYQFLPLNAK